MRSIITRRLLFTLTLLATLSMICSEADARGGRGGGGRSGGGRSGGGRSGASGGGRNVSSRPSSGGSRAGGSISNSGKRPGQFGAGQLGSQTARPGNLSSRAGGLGSGLADKSQLQGMLGQQSDQRSGKFSERSGQYQQNAQTKANDFQGGSQPFTASWYAQHPNAWQATHPYAGAAAVATTASVAAWVGAAYYAPAGSGASGTTIIYEEAPAVATTAGAAPAAAPTYAAQAAPTQPASAEAWLPVGIYQLATNKDVPALMMLQLVVDHQGTLRGVYYDSITDTSHNIVGTLDPSTKVAKWRLESNSRVTFQASLDGLTQPTGSLQVNIPTGPQKWLLARVESQQ
ncbi:MAG: hypothetical protein GXP24_08125 [Planctomycetes bacterium]|nr:hypothetical protein [Planctomycetota bacterium]